jgi:transposase InsO family protein
MQGHCTAIKVLRSDRGGEYLSGAFDQHLKKVGTARKLTTHDTPQLNGITECLN